MKNGKGSRQRPCNKQAFDANYQAIYWGPLKPGRRKCFIDTCRRRAAFMRVNTGSYYCAHHASQVPASVEMKSL